MEGLPKPFHFFPPLLEGLPYCKERKMAVTIYDVAKKAGVGIGTVSRTINDSTQVAPATREKVLQAIKDLNYQPHALAQGLARKKTNMIAIIVPFFTGYFYHELFQGIQRELSKYQYDLILYNVDQTDKVEGFLERTLQEKRVDGVLLISAPISDEYAHRFLETGFPIVLLDAYHSKLDSITVENEEGAYQATQHLIHLGYDRIGMIDAQLKSAPAQVRLGGFKKALVENRIAFNEDYLVISDTVEERDGFNREAGYNAMMTLIALGEDRPTAVFISSDIQAVGAIKAAQDKGLNIPEDIAIVGFDDIELSEYIGLTTMRQPMEEMGKSAVHRLMEKIVDSTDDDFKKVFSTELIIRKSCGNC